jgi:Cu/Ag efflux protein CusF
MSILTRRTNPPILQLAALGIALLFAGCARESVPADAPEVRGVVQDLRPGNGTILVKHEDIPGVMPAMTMAFRVDENTLRRVQLNQAITARLVRREDGFWLVEVEAAPDANN